VNKSDDALKLRLPGSIARLAGGSDEAMSGPSAMSSAALAGAVAEAFDDDEQKGTEDDSMLLLVVS
jgi:hypothetical protein